jgi:hypothetical protein
VSNHVRVDAAGEKILTDLAEGCDAVLDGFWSFGERTHWHQQPGCLRALQMAGMSHKMGPGGTWDGSDIGFATSSAVIYLSAARKRSRAFAPWSAILRSSSPSLQSCDPSLRFAVG